MNKNIRDSSVYISISSNTATIDESVKDYIDSIFKELFNSSAHKISDISAGSDTEIVYEIMSPIIDNDSIVKEFFENMEILLEELKDYNPHFTQHKRGDS